MPKSSCAFCPNEDGQQLGIIPNSGASPDIGPFGCRVCMIVRELWCIPHNNPHNDWGGGHLCLICHGEMYAALQPRAEQYYERLLNILPEKNARAVSEWAEDPENCVPLIPPQTPAQLVLWSLTAMSLTRRISMEELLDQPWGKPELEALIPGLFPIEVP